MGHAWGVGPGNSIGKPTTTTYFVATAVGRTKRGTILPSAWATLGQRTAPSPADKMKQSDSQRQDGFLPLVERIREELNVGVREFFGVLSHDGRGRDRQTESLRRQYYRWKGPQEQSDRESEAQGNKKDTKPKVLPVPARSEVNAIAAAIAVHVSRRGTPLKVPDHNGNVLTIHGYGNLDRKSVV